MTMSDEPDFVLASASPTRQDMLRRAGLNFDSVPARVDEAAIKETMTADKASPAEIAEALAEQKARYVSRKIPGTLVLGADQVLAVEDKVFSKPESRDEAVDHLKFLRNRRHALISCAVFVDNNERVWHKLDAAHLTMRDFSDGFIESYLDRIGNTAFESPGSYRVEENGIQLFSRITGDHFTILGLPLIPVLDYLRTRGIVAT